MCVLLRGWVSARGFGATPLSWPHSSQFYTGTCTPANGSLCPGANCTSFRVWVGTGAPIMVVSILELASLHSECVHQSKCLQWLPQPWSEAEPGPFPPSVQTVIGNGSLHLNGEQHRSKRCWSSNLVQAGGTLGWSWQANQSPRKFSICFLCTTYMRFKSKAWASYSPVIIPTGFQNS